jgi:hypothetical protein
MMTVVHAKAYHFPGGFKADTVTYRTEVLHKGDMTVRLKIPMVTRGTVEVLADFLKKSREQYLAHVPVAHIIRVLDEASRRWMDRDYAYRRTALKTIPVLTGFSREVVEASIDAEMESSLKGDMWRALKSEIGNPLYLDDFQFSRELDGYRRAFGPELIVSFFSENIPALPHLLFMRSALVKAACLGKVAAGEPTFAPLYVKTIEDIDPGMAQCMAVLYWPGGEEGVEEAAFNQADSVIVFGGVEACNSLIERIPRRIRVLIHGHKLGFGVIGRNGLRKEGLKPLADAVAYDHTMFDQKACLAPHVYYLEQGGEVSPREFAQILAESMEEMNGKMPKGTVGPGEASAVNQLRGRYELKELNGEEVALFCSARGTEWTVIYERDPGIFRPSPLNRVVRIWGVDDVFQILPVLKPLGPFLQNAAVAVGDDREMELIQKLGDLGVARITVPGQMPLPTMMWHHDGISPLAMMLRWCDVEKKPEIAGLEPRAAGFSAVKA